MMDLFACSYSGDLLASVDEVGRGPLAGEGHGGGGDPRSSSRHQSLADSGN